MKAAIMGYGTIGSGVYEVLDTNCKSVEKKAGEPIEVKYILDLREFPGSPVEKLVIHDVEQIVNDPEIGIVVETMGGTKPAYEFVKRCLLAGKHVVTSNKALVAAHGTELIRIAAEKNISFLFEASVGGGYSDHPPACGKPRRRGDFRNLRYLKRNDKLHPHKDE